MMTGAWESLENQVASCQSPLLESPGEQRDFPFMKSAYSICAMTLFSLPAWDYGALERCFMLSR